MPLDTYHCCCASTLCCCCFVFGFWLLLFCFFGVILGYEALVENLNTVDRIERPFFVIECNKFCDFVLMDADA